MIIRKRWEIEAAVSIQKIARKFIIIVKNWKKIQQIRKTK